MSKSLYSIEPLKKINCPQCGYSLPIYFNYTKIIECPSCKSTIFLGDEVAKVIGEASVLSPEPSLIKLHETFEYEKRRFLPIGKIRYRYDRGFWEEWLLKRDDNQAFWLSIDEGDFALEKEEKKNFLGSIDIETLKVGKFIDDFLVSEMGFGECVGFEGELLEPIKIGQKHGYIHLSADAGKLITIEYDLYDKTKQIKLFKGEWIDPFLIKRV
jgi:DNA-directed RNA polymerase subunit RPC12/RpoP